MNDLIATEGLMISSLSKILSLAENGEYDELKTYTSQKLRLFVDDQRTLVMYYLKGCQDKCSFDGTVTGLFEIMNEYNLTFDKRSEFEGLED